MWIVFVALFVGMGLGFAIRQRKNWLRRVDWLSGMAVYLLLFLLGLSVGMNRAVMESLPTLGLQAWGLSWSGIAGSLLLTKWLIGEKHTLPVPVLVLETDGNHTPTGNWKGTLLVIIIFLLGMSAGTFPHLPPALQNPHLSSYTLYFLLFLVGVSMGANQAVWQMVRQLHGRILLLPVAIICGTLLGVGLFSRLLPLNLQEAWAVGAGFGYYSLSSILITQIHGEALGVVALLSNIIREITTLVLAPLLVQWWGQMAPIAAGGATAMDTTLPVIMRYAGTQYTLIAFFSGMVLTLIVPLLVTLILNS